MLRNRIVVCGNLIGLERHRLVIGYQRYAGTYSALKMEAVWSFETSVHTSPRSVAVHKTTTDSYTREKISYLAYECHMRYEILMTVRMWIVFVWVVTSSSLYEDNNVSKICVSFICNNENGRIFQKNKLCA